MKPRVRPTAGLSPTDAVVREIAHAMQRLAMYPVGHSIAIAALNALHERVGDALAQRDALTIGVTPRGLVIDGVAADPPPVLHRDLANRLHRRNVGILHIKAGAGLAELGAMIAALTAAGAEEEVGRKGLRLQHVRIEPLVFDVLEFADPLEDRELDDVFWMQLIEAAFGRQFTETEGVPTVAQIAEAITERARSEEGARRVYEALAGFSTALAARNERTSGSARRRFVDVITALSRPTTTRVMSAAPSAESRRRFLRDTLVHMPPALLLQLLESVAEADGEPISPQLRWLLGKLAGAGESGEMKATLAFASQITTLIEQWEGSTASGVDEDEDDPRLRVEGMRVVAIGLEVARPSPVVIDAAVRTATRGHLGELLSMLDAPGNDAETVRQLTRHVLQPELLGQLLAASPIDFVLVERVAMHAGPESVGPLLDVLSTSEERATRRRVLDLLVRVAPASEDALVARMQDAPWYLARNILSVLAQMPDIRHGDVVVAAISDPDARVRQEALKAGLRHAVTRDRSVQEAIETGDASMVRTALSTLEKPCPPTLVTPLISVLGHDDPELKLLAIGLLSQSVNPLIVPALLNLVRTRGGLLRRTRLVSRSPVMLAALQVLARRWPNHRPVVPVLQLAMRSNDPQIRSVMVGGG